MKSWFPTKLFTWQEPKTFVRLRANFEKAQASRWSRPLVVLFITVLSMSQWWFATLVPSPHRHPPPAWVALLLSLGAGLFLCFVVPWVFMFIRPTIYVLDKEIVRCWGNTQSRWKLSDLNGFSWSVRDDFAVLLLHRKTGRTIFLGLPPNMSRAELSRFLCERGIPENESVRLAWSDRSQS